MLWRKSFSVKRRRQGKKWKGEAQGREGPILDGVAREDLQEATFKLRTE